MRDLAFVDVETTGLDSNYHELIEVAIQVTTPDGLTITERYEAKMRPHFIKRAHPRALEVNGYNEIEWNCNACSPREAVAATMHILTRDCQLVGQNIAFDEDWLTKLYASESYEPNWDYHKVDLVGMCWPLYASGRIPKTNLQIVAEYLNLQVPEQKHRAMADVELSRAVYIGLMKFYTTMFESMKPTIPVISSVPV